jgi:hypothetical protein
MPKFPPNTGFKMNSPLKTQLGRWLMGRKKHKTEDGYIITDKHGRVVKEKKDGVTTKYKKKERKKMESQPLRDRSLTGPGGRGF